MCSYRWSVFTISFCQKVIKYFCLVTFNSPVLLMMFFRGQTQSILFEIISNKWKKCHVNLKFTNVYREFYEIRRFHWRNSNQECRIRRIIRENAHDSGGTLIIAYFHAVRTSSILQITVVPVPRLKNSCKKDSPNSFSDSLSIVGAPVHEQNKTDANLNVLRVLSRSNRLTGSRDEETGAGPLFPRKLGLFRREFITDVYRPVSPVWLLLKPKFPRSRY